MRRPRPGGTSYSNEEFQTYLLGHFIRHIACEFAGFGMAISPDERTSRMGHETLGSPRLKYLRNPTEPLRCRRLQGSATLRHSSLALNGSRHDSLVAWQRLPDDDAQRRPSCNGLKPSKIDGRKIDGPIGSEAGVTLHVGQTIFVYCVGIAGGGGHSASRRMIISTNTVASRPLCLCRASARFPPRKRCSQFRKRCANPLLAT